MREKGFTLVETIIVIALAVVMLGIVTILFNRHNVIYNYQSAASRVNGSARVVMNHVAEAAAQGHRVLASRNINGTTYTTGPTVLVLSLPFTSTSGINTFGIYDYVAFHLEGNKLVEDIEADSQSYRHTNTKVLSDTIQSLNFSYSDPDFTILKNVTVNVVTELPAQGTTVRDELTQQIRLRNY